jgi:hypothetical protein
MYTGLGVEISQLQMIPWAHEISTPSPVHFAVHGGVDILTYSMYYPG